jgi:metal-sulfur cluster biosynthetic enzyme
LDIKSLVIERLREVYDPDMPSVSIYDLGLIYDIIVEEKKLKIIHTLTSPFCPYADQIIADIKEAGLNNTGAEECEVETTFTPPFTMDSVPEETKLIMGWY